jgi:hypothetical protein
MGNSYLERISKEGCKFILRKSSSNIRMIFIETLALDYFNKLAFTNIVSSLYFEGISGYKFGLRVWGDTLLL